MLFFMSHEPSDEIENSNISEETKVNEVEEDGVTTVLSVISIEHFNLPDEVIRNAIKGKMEATDLKVKVVDIHRSVKGTFI